MDDPRASVTYVTNDIEQSFTYTQGDMRTHLSILASAGSDPACICRAQYREGQDNPLSEEVLHLPPEEKGLLAELLNRSKFI